MRRNGDFENRACEWQPSIFPLPTRNRQGEDVTTMTRPNTAALAPLAALLALMVVRCKGDSDPTGWIPRNGSVTGTVAVSSALPAAPLSAARDATVPALPLAVPLPTGLDAFRARRLAVTPPGVGRRPRPSMASSELIVTFRPTALGAPPERDDELAGGHRRTGP